MNEIIPFLASQVIRALLVAGAGLIGVILSFFGVDEKLFSEQAAKVIDALSVFLAAAGVVWAAWARAKLPTPPITQAAAEKTAQKAAESEQKQTGGTA